MQTRVFQVSRLRQGAAEICLGIRILRIQPHRGAEVQKRSLEIPLGSQSISKVIVRIEIIRPPCERGVQVTDCSIHLAARQKHAAQRIVCGRVLGALMRTASVYWSSAPRKIAFHLKQRCEVVVRFEIVCIILNVVQGQRFLNRHARIGAGVGRLPRQHLQPQMRHLIDSPVPRHHALRRLVRITNIVRRVVVGKPHRDRRSRRQIHRLRIAVNGLPIQIPVRDVN